MPRRGGYGLAHSFKASEGYMTSPRQRLPDRALDPVAAALDLIADDEARR
jgi:hypothetical protein